MDNIDTEYIYLERVKKLFVLLKERIKHWP